MRSSAVPPSLRSDSSSGGRRSGEGAEVDVRKLGERERTWFGIVVAALVVLLFATIFFTPYGRSAGDGAMTFDVKARQFAFVVPGKAIKAGVPVTFRLTSADVNHGFAVFNERNEFVFQAQVMPGKTQEYVYTFKKPGRYRVVCFEFCGVGHDRMVGSLQASLANAGAGQIAPARHR
jgi:cytochrome c oxidase subunit 2